MSFYFLGAYNILWYDTEKFLLALKVVPHITDAIQEWIECVAMIPVDGKEGPPDVCVIELGGTIGEDHNKTFLYSK